MSDDENDEEESTNPIGSSEWDLLKKDTGKKKEDNHGQKIFITKGALSKDSKIFFLAHPKTGEKSRFMKNNGEILEIQKFYNEPSSWFVDETIQQDGSLYVATPIDPLFLFVPLLEKGRNKNEKRDGVFSSIEDMITSNDQFTNLYSLVKEKKKWIFL